MSQKGTVMAIVNQKGGVGKTMTTENLGIGLSQCGKKVLMVDCDPQIDTSTTIVLDIILHRKPIVPDRKEIKKCQRKAAPGESPHCTRDSPEMMSSRVNPTVFQIRKVILRTMPQRTATEISNTIRICITED